MKKKLIIIIFFIAFNVTNGQSNRDIANVYIKRAYEAINTNIDFDTALIYFEKAMKRTDTILDRKVAALGSTIYFETHHKRPNIKEKIAFLEKSKMYCSQYFNLYSNRSSEEYISNTEDYVLIQETIEKLNEELKKNEEERIRKEKELKKIDSLKTIWTNKSNALSIKADSIYSFDKNNVSLYTKNGFYGIINDRGEIIVKAEEYKDALSFDGFILLKNKKQETTKVYCYNTNSKKSFLLPNIADFNPLSTHYGKIMLPRANGMLVTYPNNSYGPMIYDLKLKKIIETSNKKDLFKNLKKNNIIDKYNKDSEVKINKLWYSFGPHLGGGVYTLYFDKNYDVNSYLCSIDGRVISAKLEYQFIGAFYNNRFQALKNNKIVWINQNGTELDAQKNGYDVYKGNSKIIKINDGIYQIMKEGKIIRGNEELEKMTDFLKENILK